MSGKYNQRPDEMDKSNWKFQKPEIFTTIFQLIGTVPATLLTDSSTLEKNPAVLRLPWNVVICIGPEDNSLYQYVSLAMSAEDFVDDKAILLGKENHPLIFFDENNFNNPLLKNAFISSLLSKALRQIVEDAGLVFIQNIPKDFYVPLFNTVSDSTRKSQKNIVVLNGQSNAVHAEVIDLWEKDGQVRIFKEQLAELWESDVTADDAEFYFSDTELGEHLFIDSKLEKVDSTTPDKIKHFAQLLTLESVETNPMITKADEPTFFQYFLENSSGGFPNWYWYAGSPVFHVQRDIEKGILDAVHNAFVAVKSATREGAGPILLEGQNLSGKTNILCSIAYQIFCEKKYPVIFMPNLGSPAEWKTNQENLKYVLDELKEKSKTPVLVVWDTACKNSKDYHNIIDFKKELDWCGYKAVILCSGYERELDKGLKRYFDEKTTFPVSPLLSSGELDQFETLLAGKRILERDEFHSIRDKYAKEPTFLASLYQIRRIRIRTKLCDHVSREVSSILDEWGDIVKEVMQEAMKRNVTNTLAIFNDEFAKLKFDENDEESVSENDGEEETITEDSLRNAMGCLALCSIYSCSLNIEFFVRVIQEHVDNIPLYELYSLCTHNNMLREVTEIPSPKYQFRSNFEAKLFLSICENCGYSQFDILKDLIKTAAKEEDVDVLIHLLKESGPNGDGSFDSGATIWKKYRAEIPGLWKMLADRRKENSHFKKILPLEKSFIREWYKETKTPDADAFDDLSTSLKELSAAYESERRRNGNNFFNDFEIMLLVEYTSTILQFPQFEFPKVDFEKLKNDFLSIPHHKWFENSYIPTVFLFLGCRMFDNLGDEDKKLTLISFLTQIAEGFSSEDDEDLGKAIQSVYARMDKFKHDTTYLDESIGKGNSAAISVRVRLALKELEDDGHIGYRKDCINSLLKDYLENSAYKSLLEKDPGCLWLLITLKWEALTGYRTILPKDNSERLRVPLSRDKWKFFYDRCDMYKKLPGNDFVPFQITFLRELSCIHLKFLNILKGIQDFGNYRHDENALMEKDFRSSFGRKSLYLICDEQGTPLQFEGIINQPWTKENRYGLVSLTAFESTTISTNTKYLIRYYRPEDLGLTKTEARQGMKSKKRFYLTLNQTGLKVDRSDW